MRFHKKTSLSERQTNRRINNKGKKNPCGKEGHVKRGKKGKG